MSDHSLTGPALQRYGYSGINRCFGPLESGEYFKADDVRAVMEKELDAMWDEHFTMLNTQGRLAVEAMQQRLLALLGEM